MREYFELEFKLPSFSGRPMHDSIEKLLDELRTQNDNRISLFDIQIAAFDDGILSLKGKLLYQDQLAFLKQAFSNHFPGLTLDTASMRILSREPHERVHVATNLTGLYERPTFGMPLSSELYFGTELEVLDEEGRWVFTRQRDGYLGWVYRPYLGEGLVHGATHLVLAPSAEVRAEPDEKSEIVTRLVSGTGVTLEESFDGWSRISANKMGWMPSACLRSLSEIPKTIEEKRKTMVEDAKRMLGVPYLWGGTSGNGIDCSGFARLLHHWVGIDIPRDADMQYEAAKPVEPPFEVGDLLFFAENDSERKITHVGMSLGEWKMVHSSRSRNGVYMDDVEERPSLKEIFVSAGRFLR
jgi:gamma-D-glutamyl-L-lysine dipeptidyl-peptidase